MKQVTTIRRGGQPRPFGEEKPACIASAVNPPLMSTEAVRNHSAYIIAPQKAIGSTVPETKSGKPDCESNLPDYLPEKSDALSLTANARNKSVPLSRTMLGQRRATPGPCRPSLSEQLASIGAKSAALTLEIKQTHGLVDKISTAGKPLHCFPANSFIVGSLHCRYPSPVSFYQDRCEYTFHHPHDRLEIRMVMYYSHMTRICFTATKISFYLSRRMEHFKDFDPNNANHPVAIELPASAISAVRSVVTDNTSICASYMRDAYALMWQSIRATSPDVIRVITAATAIILPTAVKDL